MMEKVGLMIHRCEQIKDLVNRNGKNYWFIGQCPKKQVRTILTVSPISVICKLLENLAT